MLTPEEMAELERLGEASYQEVMSRTEDREDDRVYQEQGAGALAEDIQDLHTGMALLMHS